MPGLWKDLPEKIHHKVSENWINTILLIAPFQLDEYSLVYVARFEMMRILSMDLRISNADMLNTLRSRRNWSTSFET
ncbi:unnamed protein product [Arabis nemorensis]|uniref:Uncharacterized protein n=1 Tax=Arabis nemorensis TaxID=586526 RepID=A0A565CT06_9BRAS|nr:unnamed protein product [Arabis nemorensis]